MGELVISHNAGIYISKEDYGTGTNVIGVGNIYDNDIFDGEIYRLGPVNDEKFLLEENDLIYGESSLVPEGIARTVCVGKNGVGSAFAWHTRRVKLDQSVINSHFATLELNYNIDVRKYLISVSTQTALTGMTTEGYFGVTLSLPTVEEQAHISSLFKQLDNLITLHQRESYRSKGKHKTWEQRKFGELLNETRNKTTVEDEDTLLSCAIDGMYLNSELFSHFRGSSNIGYLKIKKNDLILSAQNLHLGNCNVNLRFEHGIISPAYKVYELVECDPLFMQAWVKQDTTKDFFLRASTEGASVCRKNIVWEELYKQTLPVPTIAEQEKIGLFFDELDNLITLHRRT